MNPYANRLMFGAVTPLTVGPRGGWRDYRGSRPMRPMIGQDGLRNPVGAENSMRLDNTGVLSAPKYPPCRSHAMGPLEQRKRQTAQPVCSAPRNALDCVKPHERQPPRRIFGGYRPSKASFTRK